MVTFMCGRTTPADRGSTGSFSLTSDIAFLFFFFVSGFGFGFDSVRFEAVASFFPAA
jgi:hypothetical protein